MKKFIVMLLVAVIATPAVAQTAKETKKEVKAENKAYEKKDKILTERIKEKVIKDARKDAKSYEKEGYKVIVGKLPLEKQIEGAWKMQEDREADGTAKYIVATNRAIGGNYSAAKMQADNLAKLEIAGQIESEVAQLIESKVSNEDLSADEAVSLTSTVSAAKTKIQQQLGRVIPLVEMYRVLKNGNNEVQVIIAYSTKEAFDVVKKSIRNDLKAKSEKLAKELDSIL